MNTRYLDALAGENRGRPPVWLMRQAGRYMPEYRALREKHSLEHMFHDSALAIQVTLQPIERFGMDAAILFSDILVILEALGFSVRYPETGGPFIQNAPCRIEEIEKIYVQDVEKTLSYVKEAIQGLVKKLSVPLIGFCGAPFTIAAYLLDRPVKEDMKNTKRFLFEAPEKFHQLLEKITDATRRYLHLQMDAGVHAIQLFDSWAGALSSQDFTLFAAPYLKSLIKTVQERGIPVTLFSRGSCLFLKELEQLRPNAISFDWHKSMKELRKELSSSIAAQGNLDPSLLRAHPDVVEKKLRALLEEMRGCPNYIVNLGHGIFPDCRVDSVQRLVDTVKSFV